ncbi:hypothetical protein SPHINGOR109_90026 [Sphingorhabdus sp. 109]|nr:hypothetical protein SPHINGOR109_90026 [Sphingorhabdus sp. 109]
MLSPAAHMIWARSFTNIMGRVAKAENEGMPDGSTRMTEGRNAGRAFAVAEPGKGKTCRKNHCRR